MICILNHFDDFTCIHHSSCDNCSTYIYILYTNIHDIALELGKKHVEGRRQGDFMDTSLVS